MKKFSPLFTLALTCGCIFSACSFIPSLDIQKRHYRKGFYFEKSQALYTKEKSGALTIEVFPPALSKAADTCVQKPEIKATVDKKIILPGVPIKANAKPVYSAPRNERIILSKKSAPVQNVPAPKPKVPGWLSDTLTVILFTLVCFIIPPYWFYFLGFVYMLAKNKKKSTAFVLAGLVDTAGLVLAIVLLIAGSSLFLPVYLATVGFGLVALAIALIRYFTL